MKHIREYQKFIVHAQLLAKTSSLLTLSKHHYSAEVQPPRTLILRYPGIITNASMYVISPEERNVERCFSSQKGF